MNCMTTEYLLRIFQIKKIPFNAYDMASDEQARRLWKRKVPPAKQQLPGMLIDNTFIGVSLAFLFHIVYLLNVDE